MKPNDHYKETQVRSASPAELILLLYDGAISFLNQARYHLQAGNIEPRVILINRSLDVISELLSSLNMTEGGEYTLKLSQLYTYMIQRLYVANLTQSSEAIGEVLQLLGMLREAWNAVVQGQKAAADAQPVQPPSAPVLP